MMSKEAAGMGAFFIMIWMFLIFAMIFFWMKFLIQIVKNEFTGNNKIIWIILMLGFPPIAIPLYHFIGKGQIKRI